MKHKTHLRPSPVPVSLPVLLLLVTSSMSVQADPLVDLIRDALRAAEKQADQGNAFQSLMMFGSMPGISAANFTVDDDPEDFKLNTIKLPLTHEFEPIRNGIRPYTELNLGYVTADETEVLNLSTDGPTRIEADYTGYSVLGGAGLSFPITENLVLRPIFMLGYSHLSEDTKLTGPYSDLLAKAGKDLIFDIEMNSYQIGGALELAYQRVLDDDIRLTSSLRYNLLYSEVYDASDSVLETNSDFGVLTARAESNGPTGKTAFGRDLRWIGFIGGSYLTGSQSDALGFDSFVEIGGGIELVDREVIEGIEGISLRASGIIGNNVTGWTFGAKLEF